MENLTDGKKHYYIRFVYDDPYPKVFEVRDQVATSPTRAIDLAYKALKKEQPRKRELKELIAKVTRLI